MKNIVLIGMPGCGKSYLGKLLAQKLNRPFIDIDEAIEKENGMTIAEMCQSHGKPYFREKEKQAALKISQYSGYVISAGGGIVLNDENMQALKNNGAIVFINRTPQNIAQNVNIESRPFLENKQQLFTLYDERIELYKRYRYFEVQNNDNAEAALAQLVKIANIVWGKIELYVIGDPIEYSKSPIIHMPILNLFCSSASFGRCLVKKGELAAWVSRVKKENITGFNLTMPHKIDILQYLDYIDDEAKIYGSVNTVVNRDGKLYGYNTDALGFFMSLADIGFYAESKNAVILGAGGVANALAKAAALEGAKKLTVLARDTKKAAECAKNAKDCCNTLEIAYDNFEYDSLANAVKNADLIINATPLGMHGMAKDYDDLSFLQSAPKTAVAADLIYNPEKTSFLSAAEGCGLKTINGTGMLIYQAMAAQHHYIGTEYNLKDMYDMVKPIVLANQNN